MRRPLCRRAEAQAVAPSSGGEGGSVRSLSFPSSPRRFWDFLVSDVILGFKGLSPASKAVCAVVFPLPSAGVVNTIARLAKTCTLRLTAGKLYFILCDKVANGGVSMWCELCQVSMGELKNKTKQNTSLQTRACSWGLFMQC